MREEAEEIENADHSKPPEETYYHSEEHTGEEALKLLDEPDTAFHNSDSYDDF
jgi:hypothetical protein